MAVCRRRTRRAFRVSIVRRSRRKDTGSTRVGDAFDKEKESDSLYVRRTRQKHRRLQEARRHVTAKYSLFRNQLYFTHVAHEKGTFSPRTLRSFGFFRRLGCRSLDRSDRVLDIDAGAKLYNMSGGHAPVLRVFYVLLCETRDLSLRRETLERARESESRVRR